jgi:hypothetical protein
VLESTVKAHCHLIQCCIHQTTGQYSTPTPPQPGKQQGPTKEERCAEENDKEDEAEAEEETNNKAQNTEEAPSDSNVLDPGEEACAGAEQPQEKDPEPEGENAPASPLRQPKQAVRV